MIETNSDPEVTALRDIIIDGWPDSAKQLPKSLWEFWSCKDEFSVEDGLVLKGEHVLIPTAMRSYILQNIHAGQVQAACQNVRVQERHQRGH